MPHAWKALRGVGRDYCHRCGLVALHNEVSRRAMRAPCRWWED